MTNDRPYDSDFDDYTSEKYPPDWKARREKVLARDGYRCQVCGVSNTRVDNIQFDIDHIIPKSEDGSHSLTNLQTLCRSCHADKHPENTHLTERAREWEQRNSTKRPLWQRILKVLFVVPMLFSVLRSGRTVIDDHGREIELTALESVSHMPSDRAVSVDVRVATLWNDPPESIQQYGLLAPVGSDRSDDVELIRFVGWADNDLSTMEKNERYRLIGALTSEYNGDIQLKLDRKSEIQPLDH